MEFSFPGLALLVAVTIQAEASLFKFTLDKVLVAVNPSEITGFPIQVSELRASWAHSEIKSIFQEVAELSMYKTESTISPCRLFFSKITSLFAMRDFSFSIHKSIASLDSVAVESSLSFPISSIQPSSIFLK